MDKQTKLNWGYDWPGKIRNWLFLKWECTILFNIDFSINTDDGIEFYILDIK